MLSNPSSGKDCGEKFGQKKNSFGIVGIEPSEDY